MATAAVNPALRTEPYLDPYTGEWVYPEGTAPPDDPYGIGGGSQTPYQPAPVMPPGAYVGDNPKDLLKSDQGYVDYQGNVQMQQGREDATNYGQEAANAKGYLNEVYDPLIGGRGGYSEAEANAIMREQETANLLPSDADFENLQLTDEEKAGITGDPSSQRDYFDPEIMNARLNEGSAAVRSATGSMSTALTDPITGKLELSTDYGEGVDGGLTDTEGRVRAAVDPARLRSDPGALAKIRMTPEEQQRIVTGAGISARTGYQAGIDDLEQKGRAAGVDPLGVAAMKAKFQREGAGAAGDAMTLARISASREAASREGTAENMRRAGEMGYSDLATGTELTLGDQGQAARTRREAMRLGAEQDIAGRRMGAAETAGRAYIDTEKDLLDARSRQEQFNVNAGTGIATSMEQDRAARAAAIAAARTATSANNLSTKFGMGTAVNNTLSGRSTGVADQRLAQAKEGRTYLQTLAQQAEAARQAALNRQLDTYEITGRLKEGSTEQAIQQANAPKLWEKIANVAIRSAGAASGFGGNAAKPSRSG